MGENQHRYHVALPDGYYVLVKSGFRKPDGGAMWIQNVKPGERILEPPWYKVSEKGLKKPFRVSAERHAGQGLIT